MLKTVQLLRSLVLILITTVAQSTHFLRLVLSSRAALSAEVLFLRKQLAVWWRWKSRLGRPRIREDLCRLMVRMVRENPTWGEERVAAELSVKFGILVSPRTVRAYWPHSTDPKGRCRTSSPH